MKCKSKFRRLFTRIKSFGVRVFNFENIAFWLAFIIRSPFVKFTGRAPESSFVISMLMQQKRMMLEITVLKKWNMNLS